MTELLHQLAALLYAGGAALGWRAPERSSRARGLHLLIAAAALLHAVGFVVLHREEPPIPLESFPAALSLIGWLIAVSYLLSLRAASIRAVGPWVGIAAALFTAAAWLGLLVGPREVVGVAGNGAWSHAHVLLSATGFSLLALASLAGVAYLVKERSLKHKSAMRGALPPLESLDRMEHFTLAVGFPLLTLGAATGFVWGWGLSPLSAHAYWLLLSWAVYLVPVSLRVVRHQHGERPARAVVVSFAILAFAYIGVRLMGGGV